MACGQPPWKRWPIRLQRMEEPAWSLDRKSTRLNSSHLVISYAVFCLKKKKQDNTSGDDSAVRQQQDIEPLIGLGLGRPVLLFARYGDYGEGRVPVVLQDGALRARTAA